MAKRAAENQLTKDGVEDPGSGEDDQQSSGQGGSAPVEGRPIRGLPKRKGLGGAPPGAASSASAPANPFASSGAAAPAPSGSSPAFSFGGPAASASAPVAPFSFGGAPTAASTQAKPASPFSGFAFASGGTAASSSPAAAAPPAAEPAKSSAFGGFSFGQPVKPATAASSTPAEALKPSASAFSGFSFASSAAKPTGATPAPTRSTTSFGSTGGSLEQASSTSSSATAAASAPKPFSGFSFGSALASTAAEASSSRVYPDLPKEDASGAASQQSPTGPAGMPKPPLSGSFSFGAPSPSTSSSKPFNPQPAGKLDGMPAPPAGGFSFGSASTAKKPEGVPQPASSGLSFGAKASTSKPSGTAPAASNGFSSGSGPNDNAGSFTAAPNGSAPASSGPPSMTAKPNQPGADNVKYLSSVRGLNHSFAQALVHKVQIDPFCDIGEIMDRLRNEYDQHLAKIRLMAGIDEPKRKRQRTNADSASHGGSISLGSRPEAAPADVRREPSSLSNAAPTSTPTQIQQTFEQSKSQDTQDQNMDTADPAPSHAKLPAPASSQSAVSMFRDILKQSAADDNTQSQTSDAVMRSPGTPSAKQGTDDSDSASPGNKRKSAIFSITPTVKSITSASTTPAGTPSKPLSLAPATFSLGSGGSPAPAAATGQLFGTLQRPRTVSTGFSFGSATADKQATAAEDKRAKPAFTFGAGAGSFNFSKPAGTEGVLSGSTNAASNPFAPAKGSAGPSPFSFGAPAQPAGNTSSAPASSAPNPFASSAPPSFVFGAPSSSRQPAAAPTPSAEAASSQDKEEKKDAEPEEAASDQTPDLSKVAGPAKGEEDEDTVWQSTGRLFKKVDKDGKATWGETQDAYIKINRLKGTGGPEDEDDKTLMRRIIVRNVVTGKLLLNFSLKNLLALHAMTKQSAIRVSVPNAENKLEMYLFGFSKEENAPAKAAACLRAIQKERRGLGLDDFSQLP